MKLFSTFTLLIALILIQFASSLRLNHNKYLSPYYSFDQGPTGGLCSDDEECDGRRFCSQSGQCLGVAREPKNRDYYYDQTGSRNRCDVDSPYKDYYCDGNRTCSDQGVCQGYSR